MTNVNYCNNTLYEIAIMSGYNGKPTYAESRMNLFDYTANATNILRRILINSIFKSESFEDKFIKAIDDKFSIMKMEHQPYTHLYYFKIKKSSVKTISGYKPQSIFYQPLISELLQGILATYENDLMRLISRDEEVRYFAKCSEVDLYSFCYYTVHVLLKYPNLVNGLFDVFCISDSTIQVNI